MSGPVHPKTNVAIFAKAPIAGFAKTRLIPKLGAHGAAMLQKRLIEHSIQAAIGADIGPVSLWCAPGPAHPSFIRLKERYPVDLRAQVEGDLGVRMLHAFDFMCVDAPTLLLGVDCVTITASHLRHCALKLKATDVVAIPVEDGGYILIGLRRPCPALFQDICWGTSSVMSETRMRAKSARLRLVELESLWDIDCADDYDRAIAEGLLGSGEAVDHR